jgi:hypothetical protein
VYAALRRQHRVVRVAPDGSSSDFAGDGLSDHSGDGGAATAASIAAPNGLAVDLAGNVYVTESGVMSYLIVGGPPFAHEHLRVIDAGGTIDTVAGRGGYGIDGLGGAALQALLGVPYQVSAEADGSVLVGEVGTQRVMRLRPDGILAPFAGRGLFVLNGYGAYSGDAGPAVAARLYGAEGMGTDQEGKTFIADMRNSRVRMVDERGSIITVAGTGDVGPQRTSPDGTAGPLAAAGCPGALAVAPDGRVYYPDLFTSAIRVLTLVPY